MAKSKGSGKGLRNFVFGFLCALVLSIAAPTVYLRFGAPPVAVADAPFPLEESVARPTLAARIAHEMKPAPFGISEDVFEAGAHVYVRECAACHGTPGRDVGFAKYMYPAAPQLWKKHAHGDVVGVSDDDAGETYWKVANGIRLSGMPSYKHVLSDTQMWQVSLLIKNADQQLPAPVTGILTQSK